MGGEALYEPVHLVQPGIHRQRGATGLVHQQIPQAPFGRDRERSR